MALNQQQQLYEIISGAKNPLILFRKDWTGDAIAGSLAMAGILTKIGKTVGIAAPHFQLPGAYRFLTDNNHAIQKQLPNLKKLIISLDLSNIPSHQFDYKVEDNKLNICVSPEQGYLSSDHVKIHESEYKHDLIITLNAPDLETLDYLYTDNTDFFYHVPIVNIDHSAENEHYGQLNVINLTATSVSEIIYDIIESIDLKLIDGHIATCLLAGMIEKTKSFKIPTITPKCLNIASQLVAAGAKRDFIIQNLFQTKTVNILKLWGRILAGLNTDNAQKFAWAEISELDFEETNTGEKDLIGVIDELIFNIPTIELSALFYAIDNERKCVIKSEKDADLMSKFKEFKPAGNKNLIEFKIDQPSSVLAKLQSIF